MSRKTRDWSRPHVADVRAEAARARRVDSIMDTQDGVLCERCLESMPPGTPVRRVSAKESPTGEGGYVHDPATCPDRATAARKAIE